MRTVREELRDSAPGMPEASRLAVPRSVEAPNLVENPAAERLDACLGCRELSVRKAPARESGTPSLERGAPGAIETDTLAGDTPEHRRRRLDLIPLGRVGEPEEVSAAIAFLASPAADYITGQVLHENGGSLMW